MNLVCASTYFCPTGKRVVSGSRAANARFAVVATVTVSDLECKKQRLLRATQDTLRGLRTTAHQRSSIEEALVSVEAHDAGVPIDMGRLDGTWRLQYASAPDVLVLLDSDASLPFFQVGQIFQKFECQSNGGVVRNVVRWSIPTLLEEHDGATLIVSAKFSVVSMRNINLQFEEVSFFSVHGA